ncbi:MAG: relaxase/mobilization nuclease, partial [Thiomonas sp. 20-64-5]
LASMLRQERKALPEQARQTGQPLAVVQSLWALKAAQEREALQKRQAAERKALSARLPRQEVWRKWLEQQAERGDEAALAALRGIRYREQRNKNKAVDGIEGEELDPLRKLTLAGLEAQVDAKRQLVLYRGADGREKFTDTGPRIVMHDKSDESLEAALRMAAQKFGSKVDITGNAEFRERAARQAVRLGIEVVDADLQHVVANERARMQQARKSPFVMRPVSQAELDAAAQERALRVAEIIAQAKAEQEKAAVQLAIPEVDAALQTWQRATTPQVRQRAVAQWMQGMERIERQGGDVAAANAHSRKVLGGAYTGFMREVETAARQRQRGRGGPGIGN